MAARDASEKRSVFKRIGGKNLRDEIQEQIISYIVDSELEVGDLIPTEKEIEDQLGISRTAVREALKGLEALGIIEPKPGVGRFLKEFNLSPLLLNLRLSVKPDLESFKDVTEVRVCLETRFITEATRMIGDNDIRELRQILMEFQRADLSDWDKEMLHVEFHCRLYKNLDNKLLSNLIKIFSAIRLSLRALEESALVQDHSYKEPHFYGSHRQIVDAIESGDLRAVRRTMQSHFAGPVEIADRLKRKNASETHGGR